MLKIIKLLLLEIVDRIDAGSSNLTTLEEIEIINLIKLYSNKDIYMSKYEASDYLHVSRATFDNLIKYNLIPKGKKLYLGDSNIFWLKRDLDNYKKSKSNL